MRWSESVIVRTELASEATPRELCCELEDHKRLVVSGEQLNQNDTVVYDEGNCI